MGRGNRQKQVYIDPREVFKGRVTLSSPERAFQAYEFDPNYDYQKYTLTREYILTYLGPGSSEMEMFPFITRIDWEDRDEIIPIAARKSEFLHYLVDEIHPLFNKVNNEKTETLEYLYKNAFTEEYYRLQGEFSDPEKFPLGEYRNVDFLFEYASKDSSFLDLWKTFLLDSNLDRSGDDVTNQAFVSLKEVYQRCIQIDEDTEDDDIHPIYGVSNRV